MTQVAYPADGLRRDGTLFPFDARGKRNGKATVSADTRRLQQIQKELRQLSLPELRGIRKDWSKPPLHVMGWVRDLIPYLDGLIKERTLAIPLLKKQRESQNDDLRKEVAELRKSLNALILQFKVAIPQTSVEWATKPLLPSRQHAKGKKHRLQGPVGHLAAITRPWLDRAVGLPGETFHLDSKYIQDQGVLVHRFQSSLSASASYFYGRRSMTTRIMHDSNGIVSGVEFTFISNHAAIRTSRRTATQPVSIDQFTPT